MEQMDGNDADRINVSSVSLNLSIHSNIPSTSTLFKVPNQPKKRGAKKNRVYVRPVCDTCDICGQEYRCHRSYLNHVKKHNIYDSASKFPSTTQIIQHCSETLVDSLDTMHNLPAFGAMGQRFKELVIYAKNNINSSVDYPEWKHLFLTIHEAMTKDIGENKILMPSALINILMKNCDKLLSDISQRKKLCDLLQLCMVCDNSIANIFIGDYILLLVKKIFKYFSACLKSENTNGEIALPELDNEDKEAVHYISGSVVRSFYNKSKSFPKHVGWNNIGRLITEKLIESDTVPGPPLSVKGWTLARTRGRLFFVSGALYDFFVCLAQILHVTSKNKLRVDGNLAIEKVCQGNAVLVWDEAIGDSLSESASYDLMCGMVRSFSNTYGAGKVKELLNKIRKNKAEASLALRARVAPKS